MTRMAISCDGRVHLVVTVLPSYDRSCQDIPFIRVLYSKSTRTVCLQFLYSTRISYHIDFGVPIKGQVLITAPFV